MIGKLWRRVCAAVLFSLAFPLWAQPLGGKLVSVGSDTLGNLSSLWAEMMTERHPDVVMQVRAIGSGAAPTALVQGTADIGPMSRPMSPQERSAFIRRYGYAPTAVPVASDSLAVFVHRDNPLDSISVRQLDRIFSATRRCGGRSSIGRWGELGLAGDWTSRSLSVYGRTTASGTYSVFRRQILCGGDFSAHINRLVGSSAIVRAVAQDPSGIGYASAGYLSASVKQLRVVDEQGLPDRGLTRRLFLYINRPPGQALEPALAAFMDLALSVAGQREVLKSGYEPLDPTRLAEVRELLGLPVADVSRELSARRRFHDRALTLAINGSGTAVIAFISLMLIYLLYVAFPLGLDAGLGDLERVELADELGVVAAADGAFWVLPEPVLPSKPARLLSSGARAVLLGEEGLHLYVLDPADTEGTSDVAVAGPPTVIPAPGIREESLQFDATDEVSLAAYYTQEGAIVIKRLLGDEESGILRVETFTLPMPMLEEAVLFPDSERDRLLLVKGRRFLLWKIPTLDDERGERLIAGELQGLEGTPKALAWSPGRETLLAADDAGLHRFDMSREELPALGEPMPLDAVPHSISSERMRRATLLGYPNGRVQLLVPTSGELLLDNQLDDAIAQLPVSLSDDGRYVYQTHGRELLRWSIDNPSPETGWRSLWLPQWFGAYDKAEHIWHPDGAAIGVLSKFSLSPLLFGTFKAALYGMLFALPLALGAAVYTGYFIAPRLRNRVKPTIELLEAFPTVVLGFVAGLWLAPVLADFLVPVLIMPLMLLALPLMLAGVHLILQYLSPRFVRRPPRVAFVAVAYVVGLWLLMTNGEWLEVQFFDGSVQAWMQRHLGIEYDQRNALLVGMAMGVAIAPTMFSLSEDAIHAVPRSLSDGSLALGATRWQSLARVVLPAASPALLSAVLIGFARGLGETMIVLLAAGNTPLMEGSIFSGMQSISAAIAVELPEASAGSVHFRLLFLAALVLFALTFILNTVAELFRQRLRYTYGQL